MCVCMCVCVCVCVCLSVYVQLYLLEWREEEEAGGSWRQVGLRKQHPCFLVGMRNFLYPKSYQENPASLIKRGLLWLKEEKEVTKPLRVSPAKWGSLALQFKASGPCVLSNCLGEQVDEEMGITRDGEGMRVV